MQTEDDTPKHALVVGASGIVGANLVRHLTSLPDWTVTGVSRRPTDAGGHHLAWDLMSAEAPGASRLSGITHLFFAARASEAGAENDIERNLAMLLNVVGPLESAAPGLRHVCLMQGTKWYGSHLGPFRTPAKEDDPRGADASTFYYRQQDALASRANEKAWSWSALRPHTLCGYSRGYPYNLLTTLAVYGGLMKMWGKPLHFPGTRKCWEALSQATDARLLAKAAVWSSTSEACRDQAFNITNGDVFRWCNFWPRLAEFFEVPVGDVVDRRLAETMREAEDAWRQLARERDLAVDTVHQIANWNFVDFHLRTEWDCISSTAKARQYGFAESLDTEDAIIASLAEFRRDRLIP